jgi:ribosomal protein S14
MLAVGGFAAAVVAGTSPAAIVQSTSSTTGTSTTGTTTTGTTTTGTTTTGTTTTGTTTTGTTTTGTTTTVTNTVTNTTTTPRPKPKPRKYAICHRTGSKKHPYRKIAVPKSSLRAHLRHGDLLVGTGRCPNSVKKTDRKGHIVKIKVKKHKR